ncbi:hypothetical protein [Streptomyces sp. NPDC054863]
MKRQTAALRALSAQAFPGREQSDLPAPTVDARVQRHREAAATEAAARHRVRAERAARQDGTVSLLPQRPALRSTA